MGKQQRQQKKHSLRSKAAHFVSDLLNPISDKPAESIPPPPSDEDVALQKDGKKESNLEERSANLTNEPDTSSFSAFLYSFLSASDSGTRSNSARPGEHLADNELALGVIMKESSGRKSLLSRGKHTLGRALHQAARLGGWRNQISAKGDFDMTIGNCTRDEGISMQTMNEPVPLQSLPETSEPSLLLSERMRSSLSVELPALVQGRKWVLLYSTWRHGISLSTLYRRSTFCPGLSLLVVGDRKGAVFGGLVDAPMRPTNKRKYQGTNSSFVFTNTPGRAVIFRPTGANRYFTLCSTEYLALGGGGHFALYLDADLLNGSSSASETYGNSCLAHTEDFEVKEVELWGFVYASKYEEMISLLRTEAPGICRW